MVLDEMSRILQKGRLVFSKSIMFIKGCISVWERLSKIDKEQKFELLLLFFMVYTSIFFEYLLILDELYLKDIYKLFHLLVSPYTKVYQSYFFWLWYYASY